jgi:CheY-like chemotaxis protein
MIGMAQAAIKASRRSAELTQRLLAFSRKQMLAPEVIDLNQHITGMTDLMRRTLGETIEIDVMSDDDLWKCKVDPSQFENAILNLAVNARDAMPKGGRLAFETAKVHLDDACAATQDGLSAGDYVVVSVSDTGTGMSADVADRAFEPFFTTKKVGEGSGLGLSMVFGFIKQSGGHVSIASKEGAGTTLELYLPRSVETCQPAWQTPDAGEPVSRGEKILVVEDDAEVRSLAINMLGGLGYDIVEAGDGREAIAALQRTPAIDLLFTDVVLPGGLSGADIAVEATRRVPSIKVLYASGYADNILVRDGNLDVGVQFINKPFRKADLARKVRAVLDQIPA